MKQLILEPTRITDQSVSLIDLIFTNMEDIIWSGVHNIEISDHRPVYLKLNLKTEQQKPVVFSSRALKKINLVNFQRDLEFLPWHNIYNISEVDGKVAFFNSMILILFDAHAPIKTFKRNRNYKYSPWITEIYQAFTKIE